MFGKKNVTPQVENANAKAANFEVTVADMARRSEKRAWIVAFTSIVMALILAGGYFYFLPLKEKVPYLVMADAYTGTVTVARLRDDFSEFRNLRGTVVGISYDSIASHKKFIAKYNLPFPLISDEKKAVAKAFGVDGGTYAKRATFIIDGDGKIVYANTQVDPRTNSKEVQGALSEWIRLKPVDVDMTTDPNQRKKN